MKKYVSFFMTAVMIWTMIPLTVFADTYPKVSVNGEPKIVTIDNTSEEVELRISMGTVRDVKEGNVMIDLDNTKLATVPGAATAKLVQGSTVKTSPDVVLTTTEGNSLVGGEDMLYLTFNSATPTNNKDSIEIIVTLKLNFSGSKLGAATAKITDFGKNGVPVGIGEHAATILADVRAEKEDNEIIVGDMVSIGPAGGKTAKLFVYKLNRLSDTKADNKIVVSLPTGYLFSTSTVVSATGATPVVQYSSDKTELIITGIDNKTSSVSIEPFVILEAKNSAPSGKITASVDMLVKGKTVSSKEVQIATLLSYGLTLTAKEQGKQAIPILSKGQAKTVELTVKAVDGTLTNGAVLNFDVKNAEIVYNTVKVVEPTGLVLTAPKSAGANNKVSGYEVYNDSEFALRTHEYDVQDIKVTFDVVAEEKATANATVTASVTKMDDVTIDIAKISKVLNAEIIPSRVEKGTKPVLPNIVIKETEKNQLQKGDKLYLELIYSGSERDKGQNIAFETAKDIKIETTNSLKVDSVEIDKQENILILTVGSRSYEGAGTITLSNIKGYLTEKATSGQVDLQVKLNNSIEATTPFFSIGNPVAIKTVFVINNINYMANGVLKQLNAAPYVKDGRTMLPVRAVGESLGLEASWDNATKTATFKNNEKTAVVKIGASTITVNGTPMPLTVPAEIKNGSTMIELRSLATAFGVDISWDAVNKSVTVN